MTDSKGTARPGSEGGAVKRAFVKLPEVGAATAKRWFDAGWSFESTLSWRTHGGRPEAEPRDRSARLFVVGSYRFD